MVLGGLGRRPWRAGEPAEGGAGGPTTPGNPGARPAPRPCRPRPARSILNTNGRVNQLTGTKNGRKMGFPRKKKTRFPPQKLGQQVEVDKIGRA